MSLCFKRKEPVPKAIRRLGLERIEHALRCLIDRQHANAIHCARKDIKKIRAVLRLVRANIDKKEFRRLNGLLREAAGHLAPPRDAFVKSETFAKLSSSFKGQLAAGALRHVRCALRNDLNRQRKHFEKNKTATAVEGLLRRTASELNHVKISGEGWNVIQPGVRSAYRQGKRAYRTALENPQAEQFHAWRKRAKDLLYHVTLLRPVWPEPMTAIADRLDALGEYLGDDHDLAVVRRAIETQYADDENAPELTTVQAFIESRQLELRNAALALGARVYAEKPSGFCGRLAAYWQIWRCEKKTRRNG
jgi:CHAD domain-containing protein